LSRDDYALLEPHLGRGALGRTSPLYDPDSRIEQVHFLEGGVASIVAEDGGDQIEVGIYGYEGMSGCSVVLGAVQSPHRSYMQVDGTSSLRIASERLLDACGKSDGIRILLLRYVQTLAIQSALTATSNAQYELPQRLARWLLMCHDRMPGDQIKLTHDFMAMMLAVRRSGVTVTLHTLEGTGAIRASRGLVTIRDRPRLQEIAGSSYGGAEAEYARLIAPFGKGPATSNSPSRGSACRT
jgi:CRP-like cAMP-binding protein